MHGGSRCGRRLFGATSARSALRRSPSPSTGWIGSGSSIVRDMLEPGGNRVHFRATTHEGLEGVEGLPFPSPPRAELGQLIGDYLGPRRRAGSRTLAEGAQPSGEDAVMVAAGFSEHRRVTVAGHVHDRSEDEVVASVFSLSYAPPHLFGPRR